MEENVVYEKMIRTFDDVFEVISKYYLRNIKGSINGNIDSIVIKIDGIKYALSIYSNIEHRLIVQDIKEMIEHLNYLFGKIGFNDSKRITELIEELEIVVTELKITS